MTSALDLIKSSMRLATILASGETPTADEANDGLKSLNDILENWSLENLAVWQTSDFTANLVVGQAAYTIGPTGNFNTTRPVRIGASYTTVNGSDFPVTQWGLEEYNAVAVKATGGIPERFVYLNEYPLGQIILYPVPAIASTISLNVDRVLSFPVTLATQLAFPPGYEKALRYTLATNLAPEYGVAPPAIVSAIAASSKADIKRANKKSVVAAYDPTLLGDGFAYWQRGY
jgi:hypothetical protein